jgi:hypothetical protein
MSAYNPPAEFQPIFNSILFLPNELISAGGGGGGGGGGSYVDYPNAQGVINTVGVYNTGTIANTGNMTNSGTLTNTGDIIASSNFFLSGIIGVNYIQFPDGTKQYTAYQTSGVVTITGQYGNFPFQTTNTTTITAPEGTFSLDMILLGNGGQAGSTSTSADGTGIYLGGSGGASNVVSFSGLAMNAGDTITITIDTRAGGTYFNQVAFSPYPSTTGEIAGLTIYNAGQGSLATTTAGGKGGGKPQYVNACPASLLKAVTFSTSLGTAGTDGYLVTPIPTTPPTIQGGSITGTTYTPGNNGAGQSYRQYVNIGGGTVYPASPWLSGICYYTWNITYN